MKKFFVATCVVLLSSFTALTAYANTAERQFPSIHLTADPEVLIDRETWFTGTVEIIDPTNPDNNTALQPADVRGRGNSTWNFGQDKRPLRFRFPADAAQSILGQEAEGRTWVLLANHFDLSLLRNYSMKYLSDYLVFDFNPTSLNVHVYLNGDYMGVYHLTDERDLDLGRMDYITMDSDPSVSEFVLERDRRSQRGDARPYLDFVMVYGVAYDIRFPNSGFRSVEQGQYVQQFLTQVSHALRSGDAAAIEAIVDVDAFIDFYLTLELSRDPDAGFSSLFMQILNQPEGRRLVKGPVWDFDMALGNAHGSRPAGPLAYRRNYWMHYFLQVPEFQERTAERWAHIKANYLPLVIERLAYLSEHYAHEFVRNFEQHDILTTGYGGLSRNRTHTTGMRNHPDVLAIDTHQGQVAHLIDFLTERADWLTTFLNNPIPSNLTLTDQDFNDGRSNNDSESQPD